MTISKKAGNLNSIDAGDRVIDWLALEWYECSKRILHKKTGMGITVMLKFLEIDPAFTQGDIVYQDEKAIIAIALLPCDVMVLSPRSMYEMASICYETGNKHLPLFYDNDELLIPFDQPFFKLVTGFNYALKREQRQLLQPLKTTVKPHGNTVDTIFSKLMKLTATHE
ncbi:MAG: urease accessory protein UreE [Chitinophagaceae bacterium]